MQFIREGTTNEHISTSRRWEGNATKGGTRRTLACKAHTLNWKDPLSIHSWYHLINIMESVRGVGLLQYIPWECSPIHLKKRGNYSRPTPMSLQEKESAGSPLDLLLIHFFFFLFWLLAFRGQKLHHLVPLCRPRRVIIHAMWCISYVSSPLQVDQKLPPLLSFPFFGDLHCNAIFLVLSDLLWQRRRRWWKTQNKPWSRTARELMTVCTTLQLLSLSLCLPILPHLLCIAP